MYPQQGGGGGTDIKWNNSFSQLLLVKSKIVG